MCKTYGIVHRDVAVEPGALHTRSHVVESDDGIDGQGEVMQKDKGGHELARSRLLRGIVDTTVLGFDTRQLGSRRGRVQEFDGEGIRRSDDERGLPIHEELIELREGDAGNSSEPVDLNCGRSHV